MTPYCVINIKKSTSKLTQDLDIDGNGQDVEDDDDEKEVVDEEDITRDAMIKKVRYFDSLSYSVTNSSSPAFPVT
jgi:hypothetical protein